MNVAFSDFQKLDLRIATIKTAEPVAGSDKLVRLLIDIGGEERQLVAGIAKQYPADTLVGKQIVVLVNLEPKTLMGIESQGMLLAAASDDGPVVLIPDKEVTPGTTVR